MKIMTILGTRPEIIRLSRVIPLLDEHAEHVLVHTGQNYDDRLSRLFFEELGVRAPDENLGIHASSAGAQIGLILERCEELLVRHHPDRLLILGDTNSGLSAIIARRLGVPVYHMEAGNRCYDDRVPEEVNRRVIDHCSTVLMPYTKRSRENLLREGIAGERIYVTGNPIREVMDSYGDRTRESRILETMGLQTKGYFLVTMHRAENVDDESRLRGLVAAMERLAERWSYPVICSFHPRTRVKVNAFGVDVTRAGLRFVEPFGFFDFLRLEQDAFCILSDSGTVQEEACILGVPNVTIRDVTERPETIECGSNFLSGAEPEEVFRAVGYVTCRPAAWIPPAEYMEEHVSDTVARIVLSYRIPDGAEIAWRQSRRVGPA
jgi:UDP-N-acetylglucosamine 2-epimerase (non-hydrolysing)